MINASMPFGSRGQLPEWWPSVDERIINNLLMLFPDQAPALTAKATIESLALEVARRQGQRDIINTLIKVHSEGRV